MRAKMHEARRAEQSKDFTRAKALYLDAWAEEHNPRSLEAAARASALGGDAVGARRLYDRALTLAEASGDDVARITALAHLASGSPRLEGDVLELAFGGRVIERDLKSGAARLLLDTDDADAGLTRLGTLAFAHHKVGDLVLNVYDLLTGTLALKVPGASFFAFSPDDTLLAVSSQTGHMKVLDVATGDAVATFSFDARDCDIELLEFAPDRDHVVAVGDVAGGAVLRSWDVTTKARVGADVAAAPGSSRGVASRDGHWLVHGGVDAQNNSVLRVRDMIAGKYVADLPGRFYNVWGFAISNDGKFVATGSRSSLRLWDVAKKKQTFTVSPEGYGFDDSHRFGFSDDNTSVTLSSYGVTSWDVATGATTPLLTSHPPLWVSQVAWAPDGSAAAFALALSVRVVPRRGDAHTVCETAPTTFHHPVNVAFSHDGKSFTCAIADGTVRTYDTATWTERAPGLVLGKAFSFANDDIVDLAFAPDDKAIVMVSSTQLRKLDAQTGAELGKVTFKHPTKRLASRHTLFNDGTVAMRVMGGGLALFDANGVYVRDVALPTPVLADALSADGKTYVAFHDGALDVRDLAAETARTVPLTLKAQPKSITVSADGKNIAVISRNDEVATVVGSDVHVLERSGMRAWVIGNTFALLVAPTTIEMRHAQDPVVSLELENDGVLGVLPSGAFELRGKAELGCVIGATTLDRETCDDRAREDVISSWLDRAAKP